MTTILLLLLVSVPALPGQLPSDLAGRWVREAPSRAALEDIAPAWEEITVDATQVTIRRATRPRDIEVYPLDDTDRQTVRVRANRVCRAGWDGTAFVIDCREVDGGPGGMAPAIVTREVRSVDADGRLVIETHWSSGDQVVTRRERYRRQQ